MGGSMFCLYHVLYKQVGRIDMYVHAGEGIPGGGLYH